MEQLINKAYKKANLYYYTVFVKAVLFALLGYLANKHYPNLFVFTEETKTVVSTIAYLYLVGSIPLALWMFSKKVAQLIEIEDLNIRYQKYMNWVTIRIALIGVGFVINIVLFYMFHSSSFLYAAAIAAVAMLFCKPNKRNIDKELNPIIEIED